ncbi:MAG: DNA-binding protein, partial [Raoultibacter sp.]
MLVVYEFEVFEGDEYYIACPFDMDGATQGATYEEVAEMAVDWLRLDIEHRAMHGLPIPSPTFRNSTQHGGERMLVAV